MNVKQQSINRILNFTALLTVVSLLISACGSFSIQGQSQPDGDSGITITGDTEIFQDESSQSETPILGENATQILLILIGFGIFLLIILLLVGRISGHTHT